MLLHASYSPSASVHPWQRNHRIPPPVRKIRKTSHNTLPTCRCTFRNILTRTHRQPLSHRIRNPGLFRNHLLPLLFLFYPQRNPFLIPLIHIIRETIHNKKTCSCRLPSSQTESDDSRQHFRCHLFHPAHPAQKTNPPDPLLLHLKLPIRSIRKNHTITRNALPVHRKILPSCSCSPFAANRITGRTEKLPFFPLLTRYRTRTVFSPEPSQSSSQFQSPSPGKTIPADSPSQILPETETPPHSASDSQTPVKTAPFPLHPPPTSPRHSKSDAPRTVGAFNAPINSA